MPKRRRSSTKIPGFRPTKRKPQPPKADKSIKTIHRLNVDREQVRRGSLFFVEEPPRTGLRFWRRGDPRPG